VAKRETKASIKARLSARLHDEGRYQSYLDLREQLKREGMNPSHAWIVALQSFPPMDGSSIEILPEGPLAALVRDLHTTNGKPPEPPPAPKFQGANGGAVLTDFRSKTPPKPEGDPRDGWDDYSEKVRLAPETWVNKWGELAASVKDNRVGGELEILRWLYNNAGTPPDMLTMEEVPGLGALRHLKHLQMSDVNYAEYLKTNWPKLIPDKKTLEYEARYKDDGREELTLIEEFEAALEAEESDEQS